MSPDASGNKHNERSRLERAGALRWFHWLIVALSLCLTLFAWYYSKSQNEEKVAVKFDREADQVIELVQERMQKYEDALWAGVAFIETSGGDVEFETWRTYAQDIRISEKYPGINGLGVIHSITADGLPAYLQRQRESRPDFDIYTEHGSDEFWPISYIIPVKENYKAVGLDMAHEENRFTAAKRARDTGMSQITGPIELVQYEQRSPGFLFFAPFYTRENLTTTAERRDAFAGLVYAPFVVRKLKEGTLDSKNRDVGVSIVDGTLTLYTEHVDSEPDFDPEPLFTRARAIEVFGRTWEFDIRSTRDFRSAATSREPLTILLGGLVVNAMLLVLLVLLTRASRSALRYADAMQRMTEKTELQALEVREANNALSQSNAEMEQFVYAASHDLKSPMVSVLGSLEFLKRAIQQKQPEHKITEHADRIKHAVKRMRSNVDDLLKLSHVGRSIDCLEIVDSRLMAGELVAEMRDQIAAADAAVHIQSDMPSIAAERVRLNQVLQNFLSNALRYGRPEQGDFQITIGGERRDHDVRLFVSDNGPGIDEPYREDAFALFTRLSHDSEGTGVGLAIVKRVAEVHGGNVWIETTPGGGATFIISLPIKSMAGNIAEAA